MHSQAELERIASGERKLVELFKERFAQKITENRKVKIYLSKVHNKAVEEKRAVDEPSGEKVNVYIK